MRREASQFVNYKSLYQHIVINESSAVPMYMQLAKCMISAIESGIFSKCKWMPSINDVSFTVDISRDTVEKAYNYLKNKRHIQSCPGKGYYVSEAVVTENQYKIFLLFNKLSVQKKQIYDSLVTALGAPAHVDVCIYNNDIRTFKNFISNATSAGYTHYLITPHFFQDTLNAAEIINNIPKEKLIMLDKNINGISGDYAAVYENFDKDIYSALAKAKSDLDRYNTLKLVFPTNSYYPREILAGFLRFCQHFNFAFDVVSEVESGEIRAGDLYINLNDEDLITLVEQVRKRHLTVGKDVGILSYNETPIKKILLNGISTISSDFQYMGEKAAELIVKQSTKHFEVPFTYIKRRSV